MSVDQVKVTAIDAAAGAQFGASASVHGSTAIVGAPRDNAAYVFVRSGGIWTEQAKLSPGDGAGGEFGHAVAIHGDTAVVGAPGQDTAGSNSGAAYVLVRSGGLWSEQAKLIASDAAAFDAFGRAVAVHGDTVILRSPNDGIRGAIAGSYPISGEYQRYCYPNWAAKFFAENRGRDDVE